jgi:hypothetical protein
MNYLDASEEPVHEEESSGGGSDIPVDEWQKASGIFHFQQPKEDICAPLRWA